MPSPILEIETQIVADLSPRDQKHLPQLEIRVESGMMEFAKALRIRPAADEIAREKSFEALRKLKLAAAGLPRFAEISDLLDKVSKLLARKS